MPGNNYIVFKNLRPPVCIDSADGSPLKTKNVKRTFKLSNAKINDIDPAQLKKLII